VLAKATHPQTHTHTHRICSTDCFSMATTVTRTRLNVTFYVHCLSSRLYFASISVFIDTSVQYILQSTATSLPKGLFDFKINIFSGTDVYRVKDESIENCTHLHLPFPSFTEINSCKKSSRFSSFFSRNSIVSLTTFRKNVDTFRGVRGSFRAIATDGTRV